MTKKEISSQITDIISDQLNIDGAKICSKTNFKLDLDLDSLDIFQVIDKIEDTYGIEIDADAEINTFGDLINYLVKRTNILSKH